MFNLKISRLLHFHQVLEVQEALLTKDKVKSRHTVGLTAS